MRVPRWFWLVAAAPFGACGGTKTADPASDPEQLIDDACAKIVALGCPDGPTASECDGAFHAERSQAVTKGCTAEFDAVVACMVERLSQCDQPTTQICPQEVQAYDDCEHSDPNAECGVGSGGVPPGAPPNYQQCSVSCPTWGVHCETNAAATLVCTCDKGSKIGTTFEPASCSTVSATSSAAYCSM